MHLIHLLNIVEAPDIRLHMILLDLDIRRHKNEW